MQAYAILFAIFVINDHYSAFPLIAKRELGSRSYLIEILRGKVCTIRPFYCDRR